MTRRRRIWRLAWVEGAATHSVDYTKRRLAKGHEKALYLRGLKPMCYHIDLED